MDDITGLLKKVRAGDRTAETTLLDRIYKDLRELASRYLSHERTGHTLQPSALVNEAYLRLFKNQESSWECRGQFYGAAAKTMRRVLVDYARARGASKRPQPSLRIDLANADLFTQVQEVSAEFLALDSALERLALRDPRQAQIVELLFFCGLTNQETAAALGIAERTVRRDWTSARAWLLAQVAGEGKSKP